MASVTVDFGSVQSQLRRVVTKILHRSLEKNLPIYLNILLERAKSYSPVDSGALRDGHFVEKTGPLSGRVGFEFTPAQARQNEIHKHPRDLFYGKYLHEGAFWKPGTSGWGPGWLHAAVRDTESIRKELLGNIA